MSHQPERPDKDCLNCGATVAGRFCQQCGQENIQPKQSAWGFVSHFISDLLHFDGKFFNTLQLLVTRPGFVPAQYIAGKRMRYLDPARMYLFTSAFFFLSFFALQGGSIQLVKMTGDRRSMNKIERLAYASELHANVRAGRADSAQGRQLDVLLDTTLFITLSKDTQSAGDSSFLVTLGGQPYRLYASKREEVEREFQTDSSWLSTRFVQRWKAYKRQFNDDDGALLNSIGDSFLHRFPYLLFVSLPFFALVLKLLYVRRKTFYYTDHAVFTLYHYIFTFLLLLAFFLLRRLRDWTNVGFFSTVAAFVFLSGGVYLFLSMRRFYAQGWGRTALKFLALNVLAFLVMVLLLVGFVVLSVFQL